MRKIFITASLFIFCFCLLTIKQDSKTYAGALSGTVKKDKYLIRGTKNSIVDVSTGKPIQNAKVSIPSKHITTITDANGNFFLDAHLNGPAILSVNAEGYKPFSLTIDQNSFNNPLTIGIAKSGKEIVIDSSLRHLGDDNYSPESANSLDFQSNSIGPIFKKNFYLENQNSNNLGLKIGSIIGLDTDMARRIGQSNSKNFSSPAQIFINGKKIGELRINGDNQEIAVPAELLNFNSDNLLVITTGKNTQARSFTDFDDMEFINIILEVK